MSQDVLIKEERDHDITKIVSKLDSAKRYFNTLEAPVKEFVLFDHSAHYPQFEEEEKFADWLYQTLLKLNEKEGETS